MSKKQRTIAVVTGSRAEFGLLESVMRAIDEHHRLRLRTVVAGLHLVTGTWRDVHNSSFAIDARVPMQRNGETGRGADVRAVGRGVAAFGRAFDSLKPDVVVVLGDRIEAFAAAVAASIGGVYLAHIHGGDRAEGVADEAMRHAITKLAHLHFPATARSQRRLLRMGEHPEHVLCVGSPAIDHLSRYAESGKRDHLIVLQHPIGMADRQERQWMQQTLRAVEQVCRSTSNDVTQAIVVDPNRDPGADGVQAALDKSIPISASNSGHARPFRRYLRLTRGDFVRMLSSASAIVGNSSAGLIEAAALKVPCVNIGPRQNGREKPTNVIDCDYGEKPVGAAIRNALKLDLRRMRHPYGDGRAGKRICEVLASIDLPGVPLRKQNTY